LVIHRRKISASNRQPATATAVSLEKDLTSEAAKNFFFNNDASGLPVTPEEIALVMASKSTFNTVALGNIRHKLQDVGQVRSCNHSTP
jgi:hypothetical protein